MKACPCTPAIGIELRPSAAAAAAEAVAHSADVLFLVRIVRGAGAEAPLEDEVEVELVLRQKLVADDEDDGGATEAILSDELKKDFL